LKDESKSENTGKKTLNEESTDTIGAFFKFIGKELTKETPNN
jgi:hypothetical protein